MLCTKCLETESRARGHWRGELCRTRHHCKLWVPRHLCRWLPSRFWDCAGWRGWRGPLHGRTHRVGTGTQRLGELVQVGSRCKGRCRRSRLGRKRRRRPRLTQRRRERAVPAWRGGNGRRPRAAARGVGEGGAVGRGVGRGADAAAPIALASSLRALPSSLSNFALARRPPARQLLHPRRHLRGFPRLQGLMQLVDRGRDVLLGAAQVQHAEVALAGELPDQGTRHGEQAVPRLAAGAVVGSAHEVLDLRPDLAGQHQPDAGGPASFDQTISLHLIPSELRHAQVAQHESNNP
mmetsp:Transcript_89258/g.232793  ORF Transcript_89258/g.232793 Transcript_89258/m.232793 type:complete len:293 (+) Transcript_89258:456-1334(+)